MEQYVEPFEKSKHIRDAQYTELQEYLLGQHRDAERARDEYFRPDCRSLTAFESSLVKYREDLRSIIGYPPPHRPVTADPREEEVGEDDTCSIRRLFIPVAQGLQTYGIYLVPQKRPRRAPLMLCFHGGLGCPELICNFNGSTNYNDAARRLVKEGYIVFAPLFSFQPFVDGDATDIPKDMRAVLDLRAKWIGSSIAAIELFKVSRALDSLLLREEIDPDVVGVTGLSYGGFYALFLAALDTRITYCISSCYLCDRVDVNQAHPNELYDWTWKGMIRKFADAEIISLICPRYCIVESGIDDYYIPIAGARRESRRAHRYYDQLGVGDHFTFIEFNGTHEFNGVEALKKLKEFRNRVYDT